MKATYRKTKNKLYYKLGDNDWMTSGEAAKYLNVHVNTLHNFIKSGDFEKSVNDLLWKRENDIPIREQVKIVDGHRVTSTFVTRIVGCTRDVANNRIYEAIKKGHSYDWVVRPLDRQKIKHEKNLGKPKFQITGLGPRKSLEEIPSGGTWETKHLNPKYVAGRDSTPYANEHLCGRY